MSLVDDMQSMDRIAEALVSNTARQLQYNRVLAEAHSNIIEAAKFWANCDSLICRETLRRAVAVLQELENG